MAAEDYPTKTQSNRYQPIVRWYNEQAAQTGEEAKRLQEFLDRNPAYAAHPDIVKKIADLAARNSILKDFQGMMIFASEEQTGAIDDISALFDPEAGQEYGDNGSQDIDKP